ncbi:hypothetical protein [Paenibacillus glacialis]|uniref:hypothetical protein n=1 Tax=Paenibacillus glacialis TaxID=494026 RepID=UPI000B06BFFE|nr:hypothetical protein [Paenibacillus glacialis]
MSLKRDNKDYLSEVLMDSTRQHYGENRRMSIMKQAEGNIQAAHQIMEELLIQILI